MYPQYLTWNDVSFPDFKTRKANALNNMYTNLNYLFNTHYAELEKKLLNEGVKLYVGNNPNDYFKSSNAFLKSHYSLNIVGNIILENNIQWSTTHNLDTQFNIKQYNKSLDLDNNTKIVFNYTVPPAANKLQHVPLSEYYKWMHSAISLGMFAMYDYHKTNTDKTVLIWNPFGLGAFLRGPYTESQQQEIKKRVISLMFQIYASGNFDNTQLVFVGQGIIPDIDFSNILDAINSTALANQQKAIVVTSGDMLNIALDYRKQGYNVSVSMAADSLGPGNKFFELPIENKQGFARQASDENNTRRSNIIWKVLYINLKCILADNGKQATFSFKKADGEPNNERKLDIFCKDISNNYKKRNGDLAQIGLW